MREGWTIHTAFLLEGIRRHSVVAISCRTIAFAVLVLPMPSEVSLSLLEGPPGFELSLRFFVRLLPYECARLPKLIQGCGLSPPKFRLPGWRVLRLAPRPFRLIQHTLLA